MSEKRSLQGPVRRALAKACKLAQAHREAEAALAKLLHERYGIYPNDIDCDPFIDAVDYGLGPITLESLDEMMIEAGYPPNLQAEGRGSITPTNTDHEQSH